MDFILEFRIVVVIFSERYWHTLLYLGMFGFLFFPLVVFPIWTKERIWGFSVFQASLSPTAHSSVPVLWLWDAVFDVYTGLFLFCSPNYWVLCCDLNWSRRYRPVLANRFVFMPALILFPPPPPNACGSGLFLKRGLELTYRMCICL